MKRNTKKRIFYEISTCRIEVTKIKRSQRIRLCVLDYRLVGWLSLVVRSQYIFEFASISNLLTLSTEYTVYITVKILISNAMLSNSKPSTDSQNTNIVHNVV